MTESIRTNMKPTFFFSYSREDSEFALRLGRDLRASGARIWLDQLDIKPGERWDVAIQKGLTECAQILVILSPAAVASTNVMDEVSYALEENKLVIPVLHRDCEIPFRLRRLQHTDFRHDYQTAFDQLAKHLSVGPPETMSAIAAAGPIQPGHRDVESRDRSLSETARQTSANTAPITRNDADRPVESTLSTPRSSPRVHVETAASQRRMALIMAVVVAAAAVAVVVVGIWAATTMRPRTPAASDSKVSETKPEESPAPAQRPQDKWGLTVPAYVIAAGAYKTEREAKGFRDKLQGDGYPASYLWIPDYASLSDNPLFLTFIGPFDDIEACRKQLSEFRKIDPNAYGILVSHESERVQFTR